LKFFTDLIEKISLSREAKRTILFLTRYFCIDRSPDEKDMGFKILLGIYPKRIVSLKQLKSQSAELTGFAPWIIDRSEAETGSFIKAFSLLLRQTSKNSAQSLSYWISKIEILRAQPDSALISFIKEELARMDEDQRLLLLKIMTGAFRSPATKAEVIQSVAACINIPVAIVALRLYEMEKRQETSFSNISLPIAHEDKLIPKKFMHESVLDQSLSELGNATNWNAFGKKGGLKVQLIKYRHVTHLWSEDGEILTNQFPEIVGEVSGAKMNFVIEGQLIADSFEELESRLKKKQPLARDIEQQPVLFEVWSVDGKNETHPEFSEHFDGVLSHFILRKRIDFSDWQELKDIHSHCRTLGFSGLLLCKEDLDQECHFWQAVNYSVKAVILYVETGNMSPSGIHSVTFGVLDKSVLVPIAKIATDGSELDLSEIAEYTKMNTVEKFGPVRTIKPALVYELHFDGINKAPRRKSGMVLSNVKVHRKISEGPKEANTLDDLRKFMQ
jgi:DNA ligase-1